MTQPFVPHRSSGAAAEARERTGPTADAPSSFEPTSPLAASVGGDLATTEPMPTPPVDSEGLAAVALHADFDAAGSTIPRDGATVALPGTRAGAFEGVGVTTPPAPGAGAGYTVLVPAAPPTDNSPADETVGDDTTSELRAKLKADPTDVDALFKLAVRLHRTGRTLEARASITRLASVYEQRGQPAQAMRIRQMLGDTSGRAGRADAPGTPAIKGAAKVGPTAPAPTELTGAPTVDLGGERADGGPSSQSGVRSTSPLGLTARLRQTGAIGFGSTVPLRMTGALAPGISEPEAAIVAPFPPTALAFTIPLPREEELSQEVRAAVEESGQNLRDGRLGAALDACLYALSLDDTYLPLSIRIAEIYTVQRHTRHARAHAETLLRLMDATGQTDDRWMAYRILLHAADRDLSSLRNLVELLIDSGRTEQASYYATRLIRLLDGEGLAEEAITYSVRLCELIPGDTRASLEHAVLCLKADNPGGAVERWKTAIAAGADASVAHASLAAVMLAVNEEEHWRLLAEVVPQVRAQREAGPEIVDAYSRTAEVMDPSPTLSAGRGILLGAADDPAAKDALATVAGDRAATPFARAASSVVLARLLASGGSPEERGAALRTALTLLADPAIADHPAWLGLTGSVPRVEDLSLELGELLLDGHDPAGAVEVLKAVHGGCPHDDRLCVRLADAYFRTGQLGAALTVLDGLATYYRAGGQLDLMAAVLRRMSAMAPNNIKVKSRLIDTYLQRGFVEEARVELIQRADLEERSGLIKDAAASLRRAADLSWTVGMAEETFALYKRIVALAPDQLDYRHALVTLYLQVGRLAEAAEQQRAIVDISLKADRKHEAIAALHQVIGLTPDDTNAYYQLGELLAAVGEYGQAERVYQRILAITPDDALAEAKANAMAALGERRTA